MHKLSRSLMVMAALLAPSAVRADDVIEHLVSVPPTLAPASIAIPFNGFNRALGTLDDVLLFFGSASATVVAELSNLTPDPECLCRPSAVQSRFFAPSGSELGSDFVEMVLIDGTTIRGGASKPLPIPNPTLDSIPITSPSDLQSFISTGNILLSMVTFPYNAGSPDIVVNVESTTVSANLDLLYDYTLCGLRRCWANFTDGYKRRSENRPVNAA